MSERFYVSFPLERGSVHLAGPEAHHLTRVCRIPVGARVTLFNGDGNEYRAVVQTVDKKEVALTIDEVDSSSRELAFRLDCAVPLPKGDRAQFLIEKLTELGVTSFTPLETSRSIVHPGQAKLEKLERYVIEASKQCGRNRLMQVLPPENWSTLCAKTSLPARKLLAVRGGQAVPDRLAVDTVIAVGPEGGWTDAELALAQPNGWRPVDLGPRTLRMETAAIALAALVAG